MLRIIERYEADGRRVECGFREDDADRAAVERALNGPVQGFTRGDRIVIVGAAISAFATLIAVVALFMLISGV